MSESYKVSEEELKVFYDEIERLKKKNRRRGSWNVILRILAVFVAACGIASAFLCVMLVNKYRKEAEKNREVVQFELRNFSELTEIPALMENEFRKIVRDEYATYQSSMDNLLTVAAIVFTLFSIGIPIMQYVFIQKEHIEKIRRQAEEVEAIKEKMANALEQHEKQFQDNEQFLKEVAETQEQHTEVLVRIYECVGKDYLDFHTKYIDEECKKRRN